MVDNPAPNDIPTLGLLAAARQTPLSVSREDTVRTAETQMMANNYSQLPVMTRSHTVHGLISWKSIGHAHVAGKAGPRVVDCMDGVASVDTQNRQLIDS